MQTFDIIIVGGGMVGLTFATALAQQTSLSIAILEAKAPTAAKQSAAYHPRVSAISLSSQRIFQRLNSWESLREQRISPFTKIHVWNEDFPQGIAFDSRTMAVSALGHIIENDLIEATLRARIHQQPSISYIAPIKLISMQTMPNATILVAENGETFSAKLVVAADGANSWIREQAKIDVTTKDYEQTAIVATVRTELPHEKIARQVFLPEGPLAFLPLADETLTSIVWSLPNNKVHDFLALDDAAFSIALRDAFNHRLGDIVHVDKRYHFPLRRQQATHYIKSRLALIGDAAHTIHPLAGQGVNMGLLDAASLVEVIVDAIKRRRDFASSDTLRRYERWRRADNQTMLSGVDLIKQTFASNTLQPLRMGGLMLTEGLNPLKKLFMRHAIGQRSGLPALAK